MKGNMIMLNWNESYNWTRKEYCNAIKTAKANKEVVVNLDTEHSSAYNERELVRWAKEDGYRAEINTRSECVKIYLEG